MVEDFTPVAIVITLLLEVLIETTMEDLALIPTMVVAMAVVTVIPATMIVAMQCLLQVSLALLFAT
jgi:hypothetical protein